MSTPVGHDSLFFRNTSRTLRFTRLRSTARLICFFGVLIPRRVFVTTDPPSPATPSLESHCTLKCLPLKFLPNLPTRLKSACVLMRSRGRKTSPSMDSVWGLNGVEMEVGKRGW